LRDSAHVSSIDELPVGTVTFLFTDIEGSTQLLKQLGGERYGEALADHQRILREAFAEHGGHEIDTQGDSFFVAFRRAKDAVSAALASQRRLAEHAWPDGSALRVRMGIHTGEPVVGGERYVGLGVHRAARICAVGHGGQVLISQTTRELLRDDPIPDVSMRDLGEHELKDLDEPERIYQLAAPGLQEDFPELKTATPVPFAGREGELAEAAAEEMARHWRRPGRRLLVGATFAAAVVGVAVGVLLTQGGGGSSAGAAVGANSVGVVDVGNGKVVSQIPVGTSPNAIAVGPDAVWVTNTNDNTVSRIDPSTNAVQQTIDVGAGPVGVAVGGGAVWVANGLDGTVSRIAPTISRVVAKIVVGNGPSGVAYGEGFVWVTNSVDGTVSRIDPSGNRAPRTFPAVAGASGIAVGFGYVWVVSPASGTLVEIDPRSGQVVQPIAVGVEPSAVAVGAGAVWVANRADGTVSKIDPRTGSVKGLIPVGPSPNAVAADSKTLWVTSQGDGTLSGFDPSTGKRIATSELGNPPAGIAAAPQGVYVAVQSAEVEHRGGDLRVLAPDSVASIDPLNPNADTQILYLTNDGLVGFRKVGGVEGTQLVPDLAVALPKPTDSGKSYTFQVRSGIRYSNGRFVQPEDFKHELERLFEVSGRDYGADYSKIVGANRCTAGKPCNLDSGIVVDRTAHTVTFHLTAPDPDFLAKLAQPGAFAVPAGTPARDVGVHPIPATGPYRIAFFGRKEKSARLVRNRFFHEWSTDAQPQGYPDSISFSWRRFSAGRSAQIRAVERGAGDVALSGPFAPTPSKDAIERLSVRYPSQLHLNTEGHTAYFFLNTRVAPFDDVGVRRAVNIAFDRQLFAQVNGRAFAPTCRYLPPGTPGYRSTCPYGAGGVTSLDAARRLVKSSGTAGARVTVWAFEAFADQERFMVSVLDSLGYRARLKVVGGHGGNRFQEFFAYFAKVSDSRLGAQTGYIAFLGAWPSATEFLPNIVSCAGFVPAAPNTNSNLSEFCDRSIDAQMAHASAVQAQDPPAATLLWQHVERSLASQAPYVPFYNERAVDFVSKRVGNYRYNPTSGALLSQLWVK
jgi:YVTN family beta-propeller protein